MENRDISERIAELASECMDSDKYERPELAWLKEKYKEYMQRNEFYSRQEADCQLFRDIFGKDALRASSFLKIRFWRTGHHFPGSHQICYNFGQALDLNAQDCTYLLQGYYDSCDLFFEKDNKIPVYQQRITQMSQLCDSYLRRIPHARLIKMNIPPDQVKHYLRHLYYTDALFYIYSYKSAEEPYVSKHILSSTYNSELNRTLKLLGNIPRKTIIRHLILLGMPDISLEWMNQNLKALGYLPLIPEHTLRTGEKFDRMLIQLLKLYEECCKESSDEERIRWMQDNCRLLDQIFKQAEKNNLRFMHFKALD